MTDLETRRIEVLALRKALQELYSTAKKIVDTNKLEGAKLMIRSVERRITKLERGES